MHSILFYIGPVPIRAYGLMLWIALMVGLVRTLRASKRTGIKPECVVDIALYAVLAGIIGAHIVSILLDLPYYWHDPGAIVTLWKGVLSPSGGLRGLSFHGGLIGATIAVLIYTRRKGIKFLDAADLLSPALALGYAITRIGCFLNGCCYGIPTNLPWAVRFHTDDLSGALTPPSHPTQIYAMVINIMIFALLVGIEKRRRFSGHVFFSYLAMYSVYRFLIEFLRKGVTAQVAFAGLTEAQVVSILTLAVILPLLWTRLHSKETLLPSPKSSFAKATEDGKASEDKSAIRNPK